MARFYGKVGYVHTADQGNGVHKQVATERDYQGDVVRNARQLEGAEKVNDDLSLQNSISIVADAYAVENYFAIRYVELTGVRWIVTTVEVQHPRLLLRLGGVYHGPAPEPSDNP
jgi:hypothetical protein